MAKEGLLDPSVKSIFVTCGDWDLKVMLPDQCQYLGLPVADYFKQWINLKKVHVYTLLSTTLFSHAQIPSFPSCLSFLLCFFSFSLFNPISSPLPS